MTFLFASLRNIFACFVHNIQASVFLSQVCTIFFGVSYTILSGVFLVLMHRDYAEYFPVFRTHKARIHFLLFMYRKIQIK